MFNFSFFTKRSLFVLLTIASFTFTVAPATLPTIAQPASTARLQTVQVFFPKNPPQNNDLGYVEPVLRQTQSTGVAQFAVSQVIAGPNRQERQRGFTAPIRLQGTSNCSGRDFTLSIASGRARLQFCREVISAGIGDDARMTSSLNATLKQFPTVRSVVLLDRNGRCLGDMSGENLCLRR